MNGIHFLTENSYALILSMVPGMPLLMVLGCCLPRFSKTARRLLPWVTVPALVTGFFLPPDIVVSVPWFFMGGLMGIDMIGRVLLCTCAFVWLLAAFRARAFLAIEPGPENRFLACFLISMAGNFGVILAQDILGYYLFFALMSLAAYGLVIQNGTASARRAGRLYIVMVMIGEVAIFAAFTMLFEKSGSLLISDIPPSGFTPIILALIFIGFGVKIGALPLHLWMIPAYQVTPLPAATALAGAMVNAGILGWLRFLPLGRTGLPTGALFFVGTGCLAAFYGIFRGLVENKKGAVLACSSISQIGLMTVIVGLGLLTPETGRLSIPILVVYIVHHSLAKTSLFLSYESLENRSLNLWQYLGLLLPALALAGLPLTSGAIAKTGIKELAQMAGGGWQTFCIYFLPLSSLATTILVLHFVSLFRKPVTETSTVKSSQTIWLISLTAVVLALWLWPTGRLQGLHSLTATKLWQALWPVLTGVLCFLAWQYIATRNRPRPEINPPDPVDLFMQSAKAVNQFMAGFVKKTTPNPKSAWWRKLRIESALRKTEKIMGRWSVVGLFYLTLCLILLLWGGADSLARLPSFTWLY